MQKSNLITELQLQVKHRLKKHARQKHRGETFRLNSDNHQKYKKKKKSTDAAIGQQEDQQTKSVVQTVRVWLVIAWWVQSGSESIYTEKHTAHVQEVSGQETRKYPVRRPGRIPSGDQDVSRQETRTYLVRRPGHIPSGESRDYPTIVQEVSWQESPGESRKYLVSLCGR